jgi:hypothetical protein
MPKDFPPYTTVQNRFYQRRDSGILTQIICLLVQNNGDEAQRAAFEASRIEVVVVKRTDKKIKGFVVLPKRWIAERTLGWINHFRRLAKGFEGTIESALAWMQIAFIAILLRRLAYDGS